MTLIYASYLYMKDGEIRTKPGSSQGISASIVFGHLVFNIYENHSYLLRSVVSSHDARDQ